MNNIAPFHTITTHKHAGYFYVESNGTFAKGCRRCGGTGHYMFDGFDSICYACHNVYEYRLGDTFASEVEAKAWCEAKARRAARREAKRDQERLAKLAKRSAAWDALEAAHPDVWALLTSVVNVRALDKPEGDIYPSAKERSGFLLSLADKLWRLDETQYTERQIEALQNMAVKRQADKVEAAAHPAPVGRVVVTGEVVGAKTRETDYGTQYKITVKDDRGFRVYVSIPKAQADQAYDEYFSEAEAHGASRYDFGPECWFLGAQGTDEPGVKGRRITFTATLERSQDDESFAFGSRPTKGAWL